VGDKLYDMVDVITEISIQCPLRRVAEFSADPDNVPKWYVNIQSVEWKTPKPLSVGSKIAFRAKFLGRELAYTYEIVKFSPGQKLVMRTDQGPFPMETTYSWELVTESLTRMKLRNRGNPAGFSIIFTPIISMMMKRANRKDLICLKSLLEKEL
jgi:uncharacterized membrane protein